VKTGLAPLDVRMESDTDAFCFWLDSSSNAVNIGDSSGQATRKLSVVEDWTHTSSVRSGVYSNQDTGQSSNSTGTLYGSYNLTRHVVAYNQWNITGMKLETQTTSGYSAGTLTNMYGLWLAGAHNAARPISNWIDVYIGAPGGGG